MSVGTLEALDGLLKRILGSLSTEDFDIFDIMAAKDRLALYQAIPILFPMHLREQAILAIDAHRKTGKEIAEHACLPEGLVRLALTKEWPDLG